MKRRKLQIVLALVVTMAAGCFAWLSYSNQKETWSDVQVQRGRELAMLVNDYREKNGAYPDSLYELVRAGQISAEKFEVLRFQESPMAPRRPWNYEKPALRYDFGITSPSLIFPWRGSSGRSIRINPDGSGEVSVANKFLHAASGISK